MDGVRLTRPATPPSVPVRDMIFAEVLYLLSAIDDNMCIARVGRVIALSKDRARVQFFDNTTLDDVNISMVKAEKGSYLEIYANVALNALTAKEAVSRRKDWLMIRKAAGLNA